jgi:hypothetical protein
VAVIIVYLRGPFDQEKGSRTRKAINVMTPKEKSHRQKKETEEVSSLLTILVDECAGTAQFT